MPDARYFIVQHDDQWSIKFNDEVYGPYRSKDEAMLFAIDAAQKLGEYGENAEVVLMGDDDPIVPPINGRIVASRLRNVVLESVDCGHLFVFTRAAATARRVERFVNGQTA